MSILDGVGIVVAFSLGVGTFWMIRSATSQTPAHLDVSAPYPKWSVETTALAGTSDWIVAHDGALINLGQVRTVVLLHEKVVCTWATATLDTAAHVLIAACANADEARLVHGRIAEHLCAAKVVA